MIAHVVLFRPKPELSTDDRQLLVNAFERAVREMPGVRGVRVGRRVTHGAGYEPGMPDTGEYLIAIEFDDLAALQTYLRHSAHEELAARFNHSLSSAWIYDFDVGGMEVSRTVRSVRGVRLQPNHEVTHSQVPSIRAIASPTSRRA